MPLGSEPSGISTVQGDDVGILIDALDTGVSASFPAFADNITASCGVSGDCHTVLDYSLERYAVSSCTSGGGDPSLYMNCVVEDHSAHSTIEPVDPLDTSVLQVRFTTPAQEVMDTYWGRIVAVSSVQPGLGPYYSEWFKYYIDSYPRCNEAILDEPGDNKPGYSQPISIGPDGVASDTTFEEFSNNICPEFCYRAGETCGSITYEVLCRRKSDGGQTYSDPTVSFEFGLAFVRDTSPSTDPVTYEAVFSSSAASVIGEEFACIVQGTLDISGDTKRTNEFDIQFTPCNNPEVSCSLINYWTDDISLVVDTFTGHPGISISVFQDPATVGFNY